jgi:undecaprenyl-diphosphatase
VEEYFGRHGGKTIFLGRFVSLVRALAPFIAGSSGMRYRAFVPYSILGTGIWSSVHIVIGYLFSRSIDTAARYAGRGAFLLGTLIVVVVGALFLYRHFRQAANRRAAVEWMEGRRATAWLVALGRRVQPQARFLWNRVTPGGTFGLELTSLLAALAVSVFVLVGYASIIGGDPGPTPGDTTAADVVDGIRAGWLTDIAKLVTGLGAGAFVFPLAAVCAAALAGRRRWTELGVLVAGLAITFIGVDVLKDAIARPRPEGGLVSYEGYSFPSGHAAYATFYLWLAVTLVVRLRPGMARAAAAVVAGVCLTAAVGLSRVYLGVHYLSDVNGGWALGVAAFSLCAGVALVATQLRQNWADGGSPARQDRD